MLQESARNHNILLQPRINKIASWMSLKSSEINNYSRNVSAVHHLLVVLSENVEEDGLLSSKPRMQREFLGSMPIQFLSFIGMMLFESQQVSFLSGFAFAFVRHAKSFTFSCNACCSGRSSGISVSLLFESITKLFDPWEIVTQECVLSSLRDKNFNPDYVYHASN